MITVTIESGFISIDDLNKNRTISLLYSLYKQSHAYESEYSYCITVGIYYYSSIYYLVGDSDIRYRDDMEWITR